MMLMTKKRKDACCELSATKTEGTEGSGMRVILEQSLCKPAVIVCTCLATWSSLALLFSSQPL